MDTIQIKPKISYEENLIEDLLHKKIEIIEKINLEIENNLIKRKLEPLIEKLKKNRTIGENPVKNIDKVNIICKLKLINLDLRKTCLIIKATLYEQKEF